MFLDELDRPRLGCARDRHRPGVAEEGVETWLGVGFGLGLGLALGLGSGSGLVLGLGLGFEESVETVEALAQVALDVVDGVDEPRIHLDLPASDDLRHTTPCTP